MPTPPFQQVILIILDGFGVATPSRGNAVTLAKLPFLNSAIQQFPSITLQASGPAVGLPWGESGNSEVGHLNLGSGRICYQDLPRISQAIADRSFFTNDTLMQIPEYLRKTNGKLHLVGLFSPGGVHSLDMHFYAILGFAAEMKIRQVFLHIFTDGRDTPPKVALDSIEQLRNQFAKLRVGELASLCGRFYGMDRGGHWALTEQAYRMIVEGKGKYVSSAEEGIRLAYTGGVSDEMIPPTVVTGRSGPLATVQDGDAVLFVNFRPDRIRQLVQAMSMPDFMHFTRPRQPGNALLVTMTRYGTELPVQVAFPPMEVRRGLAEAVSEAQCRQLHIAESEKYAHVTVFFNGGRQEPFSNEDRMVVSSPPRYEKNYENVPEMSAPELTDRVLAKLPEGYGLIVMNYANPDAVGHTGNLRAGIRALEVIDEQLAKLTAAVIGRGAAVVITADHGNVEEMIDLQTGLIDKEHSTNPVPFLLIARPFQQAGGGASSLADLATRVPAGVLSDVAPTILELLGIAQPVEMTGVSLLPVLLEYKKQLVR
jgi:2,3-bisphosphoglycerate-independent phosphoglycerate mutase